jgi:hypothetical protein
MFPFRRGRVHASEFREGLEWVGTDPIGLSALRGRMVLLDFWTYG